MSGIDQPSAGHSSADEGSARVVAHSFDCLTEEEVCTLCDITPATAEAWRKRRKGPAYALVGNRYLYPRAKVAEFIAAQTRERANSQASDI